MWSTYPANEYQQLRLQMVERQLRERGIRDQRVLLAMSRVPRHEFVPAVWGQAAYGDHPMSIDYGQTISQPFIVAMMCELAELVETDSVLEVGTGSGYGAAVLSELSTHVHTVERIPELADAARNRIAALGYHNVTVHAAEGILGWPEDGPYDAIIVTAGAKSLPSPLLDQLAACGRMVIPIGKKRSGQTMCRITWQGSEPRFESFGDCVFVPLVDDTL